MATDIEIRLAVDALFKELGVLRDTRSEEQIVNVLAAAGRLKEMGFNPIVFKNWKGVEAYSTRFAAPEKPQPKLITIEKEIITVEEVTTRVVKKVKYRLHCDECYERLSKKTDAVDYCTDCDFMGCGPHFNQHMKEKHGQTSHASAGR